MSCLWISFKQETIRKAKVWASGCIVKKATSTTQRTIPDTENTEIDLPCKFTTKIYIFTFCVRRCSFAWGFSSFLTMKRPGPSVYLHHVFFNLQQLNMCFSSTDGHYNTRVFNITCLICDIIRKFMRFSLLGIS